MLGAVLLVRDVRGIMFKPGNSLPHMAAYLRVSFNLTMGLSVVGLLVVVFLLSDFQ